MHLYWLKTHLLFLALFFGVCASSTALFAQDIPADDQGTEVYLDFRHRGIVNSVVISYYKDDQFYLPINELFSLLQIERETNGVTTKGNFGLDQTPYTINLEEQYIQFGGERIELESSDFLIKELDNYLISNLFNDAFDLDFSIDFNSLALNLVTQRELPVIENAIRRQRRRIADQNRFSEEKYEVRYPRETPFFDGGFLDYNLSSTIIPNQEVYNLNTNIGLQLLGGDVQGAIFGSYSNNFTNFATDNLRWRYMMRNSPALTKITIGQTSTDGFSNNRYTGIRLTNEPIEARRLFDEYEVSGTTIADAEVELYMNNTLVDFQQSDATGNYRFLTPIGYGSSQLDLRIYGSTGEIIERSQRIQVPFTFQPEGVFNYTMNAGRLDNPQFGELTQEYTAQAHGAYGLTNWLTAKTGVEYYQGFHEELPTFTSSISSRFSSNYILTLEAASEAYIRGVFNVIYPNAASLNIDYTDFKSDIGFYNPSNDDKRLVASIYYPFSIFEVPLTVRTSTFSRFNPGGNSISLRGDLSARISKLAFRFGYIDRYSDTIDLFNPTVSSNLDASATYTFSRSPNIPSYIRGTFIRAQMTYKPNIKEIESAEALISRNVFQQGRLQFSFGRNFISGFNNIRFSLTINFDKIRTSSTYSNIRSNSNFTQNLRGSVGYDTNYNNLILTSRNQVGRSGAAIKLYVDSNDNQTFDDEDETINDDAVRVLRAGATSIQKNGILYITQMQPYYHYNVEVNKGAIRNPLLVPEFEKFGLISDPNRFKKVEIPFYMSGVIEGTVERLLTNGKKNGIGGVKLLLIDEEDEIFKELRTFSDGSFYDYEVPPGNYRLEIDASQLDILKSESDPEFLEFTVESNAQGDFIEGLNFLLKPIEEVQSQSEASSNIGASSSEKNTISQISIEYNISVENITGNSCQFELQYASFAERNNAIDLMLTLDEDSPHLIYNSNGRMYALRSKPANSLHDVSEKADRTTENSALVWNCDLSPTTQQQILPTQSTTQYYLQFAALNNRQKAASFSEKLNQDFNLNTTVIFDEKSNFYKIKEGPFNASGEASAKRNELLNTTAIEDIYLTKQLNTGAGRSFNYSEVNSAFRYILYLGDFSSERSATLYAMRIDEAFGLSTRILYDEEHFYLVGDEAYENWDEFMIGFTQIENSTEFSTPSVLLKQVQE